MLNIIFGALSILVAGVAAWIAWAAAKRSELAADREQQIAAISTVASWQGDIRAWAGEVIDTLSEASYRCGYEDEGGDDCKDALKHCRFRLSGLIDRGRFFFPNIPDPSVGKRKPSAYRGWRHGVLDSLVAAERVLSGHEGYGKFRDREDALIAMRREFVSAIQQILAPAVYNQEIAKLVQAANAARASDKTLGGLLPDAETTPTGADRLLHD